MITNESYFKSCNVVVSGITMPFKSLIEGMKFANHHEQTDHIIILVDGEVDEYYKKVHGNLMKQRF